MASEYWFVRCPRCGSEVYTEAIDWGDPSEREPGSVASMWVTCHNETEDGGDPMGEHDDGQGCEEDFLIERHVSVFGGHWAGPPVNAAPPSRVCSECRARPRGPQGEPCEECIGEIYAQHDDHLREEATPGQWLLIAVNEDGGHQVLGASEGYAGDEDIYSATEDDVPDVEGLWLWTGSALWQGGGGEYPHEVDLLTWGQWRKLEPSQMVAPMLPDPSATCGARLVNDLASPGVGDADCAYGLEVGVYVLATKYHDGDPRDPWIVGFYDGETAHDPPRHHVVDAGGRRHRHSGYRRVEAISWREGDVIVNAQHDFEGASLWDFIGEMRREAWAGCRPDAGGTCEGPT